MNCVNQWATTAMILFLPYYVFAQEEQTPPFECDNNFGECGTPEMSGGGGGGGGGGSILIANTDLGDTYQNADDFDDDGIEDPQDNCPRKRNRDQLDGDGDGIGDSCDNCLSVTNLDQFDLDGDGEGDVCDDDLDGDGIDNREDICENISNPFVDGKQPDLDGDGIGDACDDDIDGDLLDNLSDGCPLNSEISLPEEGEQAACFPDLDKDGVFDLGVQTDNCPAVFNPQQNNIDGDQFGDLCDQDDDDDGILDVADNCPTIANPNQKDLDRDLIGDECDDRFCFVVWEDQENCLDPERTLQAYTISQLVQENEPVRLRIYANRENEPLSYQWRVISAPQGAQYGIMNATGEVSESSPYEYIYPEGKEPTFTPSVAGEYEIELTLTTVGADSLTGEVEAQSSFVARLVAQPASEDNQNSIGGGCANGKNNKNLNSLFILFMLVSFLSYCRTRSV